MSDRAVAAISLTFTLMGGIIIGMMFGADLGNLSQMKSDAMSATNPYPSSDWTKAIIDAKAEWEKEKIK